MKPKKTDRFDITVKGERAELKLPTFAVVMELRITPDRSWGYSNGIDVFDYENIPAEVSILSSMRSDGRKLQLSRESKWFLEVLMEREIR